MDLLLINPGDVRRDIITEHLGIASLKSFVTSKNYHADTMDMALERMSVRDGVRTILKISPSVLGFSLLDKTKSKGFELIAALRHAGYPGKIIVGGYFATFSAREILRDFAEVDFVIRGEGELTLVELLDNLLAGSQLALSEIAGLSYRRGHEIIENPSRPLIQDLDLLPPVDRKYAATVLNGKKTLRLYATRGCWGSCTFCDIIGLYGSSAGKAWRRRSVQHLADEIESLVNRYSTNHFVFNDDQFLVKGKKSLEMVEEFALELENRSLKIEFELMCRADTVSYPVMRRLKAVGLKRVFLGLESFDEKQLQRFNKAISVRQNLKAVIILYRLKIDVIASVILADAFTSLLDLLKQFIVLFELKRKYFNSKNCQISVNKKLEVYRGSAVYMQYKNLGLLTRDNYLTGCDFRLKFLTALRLGLFSLEEHITRLLFKPITVLKNNLKMLHWRFNQFRTTRNGLDSVQ